MEEVKKLLVPAVSTRRGNRPNPNAALWRRSSSSRCWPSCLLPHVRSKRTGCRAHAAILGEKQAGASCESHISSPPTLGPGALPHCPSADVRWYFLGAAAYFSPLAASDQVDPTDEGPSGGGVC